MPCLLNNTLTHSSALHHDDVFCLDNISIIKDKHKYMYVTRRNMFEGRTLINPSIANRERSEPIQEFCVDLILCTLPKHNQSLFASELNQNRMWDDLQRHYRAT